MRVLLTGTAALIIACGGGGAESAGGALVRQLGFAERGQWGKLYDELHPELQEVIPRTLYLSCVDGTSISFDDIRVVEEYEEPAELPILGAVETTAVTVQIDGDRETFHQIASDVGWRWAPTPDAIVAYADGECP